MPSQRRIKLFSALLVVTIVTLLYITRSGTQTHRSPFYVKTEEALQQHEYAEAAKQRDAESVGARLKAAEEDAKKAADEKGAEFHRAVEGKDKSVAGRVKLDGDKGKPSPVPGVAAQGGRPRDQAQMKEGETSEDHDVEIELNAILKKSPGMRSPS